MCARGIVPPARALSFLALGAARPYLETARDDLPPFGGNRHPPSSIYTHNSRAHRLSSIQFLAPHAALEQRSFLAMRLWYFLTVARPWLRRGRRGRPRAALFSARARDPRTFWAPVPGPDPKGRAMESSSAGRHPIHRNAQRWAPREGGLRGERTSSSAAAAPVPCSRSPQKKVSEEGLTRPVARLLSRGFSAPRRSGGP